MPASYVSLQELYATGSLGRKSQHVTQKRPISVDLANIPHKGINTIVQQLGLVGFSFGLGDGFSNELRKARGIPVLPITELPDILQDPRRQQPTTRTRRRGGN